MKATKTILRSAMAMMSVLALISCQVAEITEPVQDKDLPTGAVVTLTSDESVSTRTEWNGYTIHWSQGDAVSMTYCRNGEWGTVMYESEPLAMTSAFAGFKVPTDLKPGEEGPFTFHAVSPSSAVAADFSAAPVCTVTVPVRQTPSANSYDKAADLMTGYSQQEYASLPDKSVPMLWDRHVAHAEIAIKSLSLSDGETLKTVTLSVDEGLAIAGDFSYDMEKSELTATDNVTNSVVLDVSSLSVDATGTLKVWTAFMPCRVSSLTVTVETTAGTYTRVISDCHLDFLVNRRNTLEIRMSGMQVYPTVIAHRGCWFKNDIPEHSLAAVRMAKRFGYKAVEIDVRTTSDNVMMVLHDQTLQRTMRNASDYSELTEDVAVADLTYEQVRSGYVMASDNPEYREPMRTLEEILTECRKYGLKAMMHTSTWAAYRMAHEILGDGNWMAFHSKTTALDYARTLSQNIPLFYSVGESASLDEIKTLFAGWGGPCGVSTMTTTQLTADYNSSLTSDGYLVQASVFDVPSEWQATHDGVTHHLTNFVVMPDQKMLTMDVARGSGIALSSGQSISRGWATMEYGATVLKIRFTGALTVKVNGSAYTMSGDGSQEEVVGRRFHAVAPSFSIEATEDTDIEYYEVYVKQPDILMPDDDQTGDAVSGEVSYQQSKYYMSASDDLNGKITGSNSGMKVMLMDSKYYAVNEKVLSVSFEADKPIAKGESSDDSNVVTMTWKSDDAGISPKVGQSINPGEYGLLCLPGEYQGTFTVKTDRYTYQFQKTVTLAAGQTTTVTLDFASPLVQPKRKVGILGDSISTFEGTMCNSDYKSFYPGSDPNVTENPSVAVSSQERTWWWMLINNHMENGVLDVNSSFSGSRIASYTSTTVSGASMSAGFVDRAYDFIDPDIIIIHGGTNDSNRDQGLGTYDWGQAVDQSDKHWYYRNAYIQLIKRLQTRYEGVQIIIIVGDYLKEDYASSTVAVAEHFGLPYVSFQGVTVDKCVSSHPTYPAFQMMAQTIYETCKDYLP